MVLNKPSTDELCEIIFVNLFILEFMSMITALDFESKNSPFIETALYPAFDNSCASWGVLVRITFPNKNFAIGMYFLSH